MISPISTLEEDNTQAIDNLIEENPSHQEIIETVISSLDQDNTAMVNHTEQGSLWKFQYGSVKVFVQLTGESDDDLLTVWSSLLHLPAKDENGLMRRLLEMNWSGTFETCFSIKDNQVMISSQRTVADMYPGEISRLVTLVANIADDNDELLKEEFGGS
ncbi:YbjN domain-containing protein [Waterburya agarophytonicola K14]|uniref:YbjN domain-containing protein n=1 Tax=Waterburya agarophytonicola KI4 TaxID=2874699 RepID=A0A964BWD8_9CYAN|nr:YbjN domain-containing protein [Waterburya agarophytonicola]MCC0179766.1 YbjN domain-containing protein [Waterburya agarophytonicola KI4]